MLVRKVLLVVVAMSASSVLSLSILKTFCGGNEVSIKNLEVPLQISTTAAASVSDDGYLKTSPADTIKSHAIELTMDEKHLGTSASIIYKTVDQSSTMFLHGDARIFASTPIIDLLLLVLLHRNLIQRSSYITIRLDDASTISKNPVSLSTLYSDRGGEDGVAPFIDSNGVVDYCVDDSVRFIERSFCSSSNDEPVDWLSDDSTCLCSLPRSIIHRYNLLHQGIGVMLLGCRRDRLYLHMRSSSKRVFPSMLDMFIGGVTLSGEKPIQTLFRELREECGIDVLNVSASNDDGDAFFGNTRRRHKAHESGDGPESEGDSSQLGNDNGSGIDGSSKLAWRSAVEVAFRRYKRSLGQSSTTAVDAQADRNVGSMLRFVGQTIIATELNHCLVHVYFLQLTDEQSNQITFADGEIEWGRWVTFPDLDALLVDEGVKQFVPDGMQVCSTYCRRRRRRALCDAVLAVLTRHDMKCSSPSINSYRRHVNRCGMHCPHLLLPCPHESDLE